MQNCPKLTLVGAGPGDPDLITLKGVKALQSADVVLYDALVDTQLLSHAPNAEHILTGKRAGKNSISQDAIHELIVKKALEKGHVVRLKGGDPFVFARGLEELEFAQSNGIETDSVVGISSIMLPGLFGIPLTERGINRSFTVLTATDAKNKLTNDVQLAAKSAPTAVIFMGLKKLDKIVRLYQKENRGDLPVAIVSNGSIGAKQNIVVGTVDTIVKEKEKNSPASPALLIFGQGARHAEQFPPTEETNLNYE